MSATGQTLDIEAVIARGDLAGRLLALEVHAVDAALLALRGRRGLTGPAAEQVRRLRAACDAALEAGPCPDPLPW